jgi:hypothetical protein
VADRRSIQKNIEGDWKIIGNRLEENDVGFRQYVTHKLIFLENNCSLRTKVELEGRAVNLSLPLATLSLQVMKQTCKDPMLVGTRRLAMSFEDQAHMLLAGYLPVEN